MYLEHFKKQIWKDVTHKAGALQGAQAQRPTFKFFQRGFALIFYPTVGAVGTDRPTIVHERTYLCSKAQPAKSGK